MLRGRPKGLDFGDRVWKLLFWRTTLNDAIQRNVTEGLEERLLFGEVLSCESFNSNTWSLQVGQATGFLLEVVR